jgi:hypothetical protein
MSAYNKLDWDPKLGDYNYNDICDSPHTKNANAFFYVGHQSCKVHTKT